MTDKYEANFILYSDISYNHARKLLLKQSHSYLKNALHFQGGWIAVSNAQLLMGITQSCVLPATQVLVNNWLPPQERGTLGAFVYSGKFIIFIFRLTLFSFVTIKSKK